jgi:precorrin-6B methylase 2
MDPVTSVKYKGKPPKAVENHRSIESQTAAFLGGGGTIQSVPSGVSGYVPGGKKHAAQAKSSPSKS